jgi:UDP-galactopyranose mutase
MKAQYDYLIVGSGLFGATFAHLAKRVGKRCLVIEKRLHLGGNVYCEEVEGIHVHKYGPHVFHTGNKEIWNFVNALVPFNRYVNCPVANYQGNVFNLPFNMNTFHQMWGVTTPAEALAKLEEQKAEAQAALRKSGVPEPRNLEEQAILLVGREIYEKLVKGYSEKQWGRPCPELPASLIKRLPVRLEYDNNYYDDPYQGVPIGGYNNLIEKLLDGIECQTDVDFLANRTYWMSLAGRMVYSGPLDAFYDYRFGQLEWRTVRYEQEVLNTPNYQGNAVVNYTDRDIPYTRIIEHKHFESFGSSVYDNPYTVISREYSMEWVPGMDPFYPVNDERNMLLYVQYKTLADREEKVLFGGRLAEYKYYDMAPVMERAREVFEKKNMSVESDS